MSNPRVWPSAAIAAVIIAVIMFLASVSFTSCEQGKAETASTTVAKKVAATTTAKPVPTIPQEDRMTLNYAFEKYRASLATVKRCNRELTTTNDKPMSTWTVDESSSNDTLVRARTLALSNMRDAACDYNLVAKKYTKEQLDAIWLVKRLEVPK